MCMVVGKKPRSLDGGSLGRRFSSRGTWGLGGQRLCTKLWSCPRMAPRAAWDPYPVLQVGQRAPAPDRGHLPGELI